MNGAGWSAGQAFRRANPESVAEIMAEYGYEEFEGKGTWTVGFEAGGFQPDTAGGASESSQGCWYLAAMRSPELNAQLEQIVPRQLRAATLRVHVTGYVSNVARFGHLGMCQRQIYAVSVLADGG
jgi:hypothetical protein